MKKQNIIFEHKRNGYISGVYFTALLAAIVTFIVFLPALKNNFVNWDDTAYVLHNTHIKSIDINLFRWAFFDFYDNTWFPLTWISLAIDYAFWGLDPWGYHLTNIVLHAFNTLWVSLIAVQLVKAYRKRMTVTDSAFPNSMVIICCVVAGLFFGLHPLRVESVAWISERKDMLNTFFGLPALLLYIGFAERRAEGSNNPLACLVDKRYLTALLLFILSLLSKPMTVTLPVIFLIIDWFPLGRFDGWKGLKIIFAEKIPFLLGSLAVGIITMISQQPAMIAFDKIPMGARFILVCKSIIVYFRMMIWPSGLMPSYPHPATEISLSKIEYLLPSVVVVLITIACLLMVKRQKIWLAVWLYYLVTLFPVSMIVQVGSQAMADRYTYLPGIGPTIIVSIGIGLFFSKLRTSGKLGKSVGYGLITGIIAISTVYSVITVRQISVWRNTGTLWSRVIDLKPDGLTYFTRGKYYELIGEYENALKDMTESLGFAERKGYSKIYEVYFARADIYFKTGNYQNALEDYDQAIKLNPAPAAEYYYQRGMALQMLEKTEQARDD